MHVEPSQALFGRRLREHEADTGAIALVTFDGLRIVMNLESELRSCRNQPCVTGRENVRVFSRKVRAQHGAIFAGMTTRPVATIGWRLAGWSSQRRWLHAGM